MHFLHFLQNGVVSLRAGPSASLFPYHAASGEAAAVGTILHLVFLELCERKIEGFDETV